jgi:hypothetical protein
MPNRARQSYLVAETVQHDRIVPPLRPDELDCDSFVQLQILGSIDLTHSASAEQFDDPKSAGEQNTRPQFAAFCLKRLDRGLFKKVPIHAMEARQQ